MPRNPRKHNFDQFSDQEKEKLNNVKKELIEAISWKVSLPDAEIEKVITSFTKVISNKLKKNLVFLK